MGEGSESDGGALPPIARRYQAWLEAWFPESFPSAALKDAAELFVEVLADRRQQGRAAAWAYVMRTYVLGAVDGLAERRSSGDGTWSAKIPNPWPDIRLGVRRLLRSPGYAAVAVLSLSVGIGLNAVLFSAVNAVLWRPLEVPRPHEVVRVFDPEARDNLASRLTPREVEEFDRSTPSLYGVAGAARFRAAVEIDGLATLIDGELVTSNYLNVLEVPPSLGTAFSREHSAPGGPRVAILSYPFALRVSPNPRALIGEPLRLNQEPVTVIGVLPEGFRGNLFASHADVWIPFSSGEVVGLDVAEDGSAPILSGLARLQPGASLEEVDRQLSAAAVGLPRAVMGEVEQGSYFALPERAGLINPDMPRLVSVAGALAVLWCLLVLLVACANVAGLALARSVALLRELGVRTALGASKWRLFGQLLTEGAVLVVPALLIGLIPLAYAERLFTQLLPVLADTDITFAPDERVLGWVVASASVAVLMAGAIPALYATRRGSRLIQGTRGTASSGLGRLMRVLVVSEVTFAVVVLVLGGLFAQTARWYTTQEPGFATADRHTFTLDVGFHDLDEAQGQQFYESLVRRIETAPEVQSAAVTDRVARAGTVLMAHPDTDVLEPIDANVVGPGFFQTMRIPILEGREFTTEDAGDLQSIVVNQAFVDARWPGEGGIGRSVRVGEERTVARVVGVAAPIRSSFSTAHGEPAIYLPFAQHYRQRMTVVVESFALAEAAVGIVRADVEALQPGLPVAQVASVDALVNGDRRLALAAATIGLALGSAALLLSAVGIFGMLAFTVAQQRGELGVRLALGATPRQEFRRVLTRGLRLGLWGIGLGLPPAVALGLGIQGLALGSRPFDPVMLGAVIGTLLAVVTLSVAVPAARAARVSPAEALVES